MLEELQKLLKHTGVYGAGSVLSKVVGFFMIPFYTHYLGPTDYGTLELLDLSLTLIALVLTTWMQTSIVRFYHDCDDPKDRNQAVSTMLIFALFIGTGVGACGIHFSRFLSNLILKTPDLHFYVSLVSLSLLVSSVNVVCLGYLRARERSTVVVGSGLVTMVIALSLNIYFIAVRHSGAVGVLYSTLISNALVTVVLAIGTIRQVRLSFSYDKLARMAIFGMPLVATAAAGFAVNFSDRFFLRHFATISTVGVYALGYKFGFMISLLVVQPFDMIWQARIYEIAKQNNGAAIFSRVFEYYCFALVAAALGLSMVAKEIVSVASAPSFHAAYTIVPVVALAYIFQGMNRFFLSGTYIAKKTMYLGAVGLGSAAANIGLNFLLIPRYGMLGEGWATAFSFCFMAGLALYVSQRMYRIPYVFSRVTILLGLAILMYFVSSTVKASSHALELSINLVLLAAFPIALYLVGFFHQQEVATGRIVVREILGRYRLLSTAEPE